MKAFKTRIYPTEYQAQLIDKDYDKETKQLIETIGYETVVLKFCPYCGTKLR